jgi:DNA-binding winged helix-turn-helix (wHTH) protein
MDLNLPPESSERDEATACFGEFLLNHQLRLLQRGDQQLRLSAKPLATLEYLIRSRHRVVPKSELLREVWGGRQEINTVEQAVRQIRRVLADDPDKARYIETVQGQGYRFIAEVHGVAPAESAPAVEIRRHSRRSVLIAACIGTPVVCVAGFAAVRFFHRQDSVARVALSGRYLSALSATGRVLWTYEFDAPLRGFPPDEDTWRTQIVDVDGDGVPEILVVATSAREHLSAVGPAFLLLVRGPYPLAIQADDRC